MKKNSIFITLFFIAAFITAGISEAQTMKKDGLDAKQRSIAAIAALTAKGDLDNLKTALTDGLNAGLTINEINEVLIQMYAYAGFPRSLNGIGVFMQVVDEYESKGIKLPLGDEPKTLAAKTDKSAYGEKVRTALNNGVPTKAGWQDFAPGIELFLKEHLFADIFARGVLSEQDRELATASALSGMEGVTPQLKSHINLAMNTGLTEAQMKDMVEVIKNKVGKKEGETAEKTLAQVLKERK